MDSSLLQTLLQFMVGFAVASVVGSVNYGMVYWARTRAPEIAGYAACFIIVLLNLCLILILAEGGLPLTFIGAVLLICFGGALAERKVTFQKSSFSGHFIALVCATFPAFLFFALVLASSRIFSNYWNVIGALAGLATTPSAIAVFRWIWSSSKTRPGIDRHLDSSEEIIGP